MVIVFALFYIISIVLVYQKYTKINQFLIVSLCALTFMIGIRDGWPDEIVYQMAFDFAPYPWEAWNTDPFGYSEHGYLFIASVIKFVFNSSRFYLFVMGGISMYLLYKNLQRYCLIPLIGLCDYIARFLLNRDFIQMRSSLVILMILLSLDLIREKKLWLYLLVIFVGYQCHHMALIGLPLYFLGQIKIKRVHIIIGIILTMVLSQTLAGAISETVDTYSEDLQYETYTEGDYTEGQGLANPMIYFQTFILLIFTFYESALKKKYNDYYLMRTAYFYSTLILIFFGNYTALASRTSTMFATVEMFILPWIAAALSKPKQIVYYVVLGFIFVYFFNVKYNDAQQRMSETPVLIEVQ
ncbi:EpsG family protein [Prevotella sp. kh1p2]|uniref:EpsG family protein n=1 Tax=Prevotella sp. kh1p2 TaxID=1761883 RepID=UPI0008AF4922|nr:EpsG family protein [Prevotella sp. kh1p2]SET11565.1 EpsG family protein [Prevotella sp. kh1p2]SNU11804.1 EpsG family protein [Prevotellaceae bacterium KH2P17]